MAPSQAFLLASSGVPRETFLFLAKPRNKVSMAEKRRMRQAKQRGETRENPFANLPKAKLDFQQTSASQVLDTPEKMSDPVAAAQRAKELLEAQRKSVDMLTMVREKIQSLPSEEIMNSLNAKGYFVMDSLLGDGSISEEMSKEAESLYLDGALEVDVDNLGSGEYTVAIQGGTEQYPKCPRIVEWVVSTTKHLPEVLPKWSLDPSVCMATLRVFDRKAFQASLKLLTGSEQPVDMAKKFTTTVVEPSSDRRRVSLRYYLVSTAWDSSCGGGISLESGDRVDPKQDRLVIWKSESCSLYHDVWHGNDDFPLGPCLEMHLVEKVA